MSGAKKIPRRQCVGCNEMKPKKELLRIIRTGDNEIFIDATGRKNGRGAYICNSMECMKKAIKNHGLERALKAQIPKEIYEDLINNMEEKDAK